MPYLTDGVHLNGPAGIDVDASGNLYVSANAGRQVMSLTADGAARWAIGDPGVWADSASDNTRFGSWWDGPRGLSVTPDNDEVFVADTAQHRIQILDSATGGYKATIGNGDCGTGNEQFCAPCDVASDTSGNIFIADKDNHRVQIFSNRQYQTTLGVTGVKGADNNHFDEPEGVAVDADGNIYVADTGNHRVQIFDRNRNYVRTIGTTGETGDDFQHFNHPNGIAVDAFGRIYVDDDYNDRVQVFDVQGKYLATIDGDWGDGVSRNRHSTHTKVDNNGNVYITDEGNHRIKKLSLGVPNWRQININGFGNADNRAIGALESFNGQLYAGAISVNGGADIWRYNGTSWEMAVENIGGSKSNGVDDLIEFNSNLYAGIWNDTDYGAIYRSSNGINWTPVITGGFGNTNNSELFRFAEFNNTLYAATWNATNGGELWRNDGIGSLGGWSKAVDGGFGDTNNRGIIGLQEYNGYLYAATYNKQTGTQVWRSSTGNNGSWQRVNTDGFGNGDNRAANLEVFAGKLYAGIYRGNVQIYQCTVCDGSDWVAVTDSGFGNSDNSNVESLIVFDNELYAVAANQETGIEVWRSEDGSNWEVVTAKRFANTIYLYWDNTTAVFSDTLYMGGTAWEIGGGKVWQFLDNKYIYLPLIVK